MLPRQQAAENQYGTDVSGSVPEAAAVAGVVSMPARHDNIWRLAEPYPQVRNNDGPTIYSHGLTRALVDLHAEADAEVVLPAMLLHDTGWPS